MAKVALSAKANRERAKQVYALLLAEYPDIRCTLEYKSPFQLLLMTILAAQCTDARVNIVCKDLFKKYRKPKDFLAVPIEELEKDVQPCGFYKNKAKNIAITCQRLIDNFGGEVPQSMEELLTLAGVGRKTANVVLGHALGVPGLPVDRHVLRVANRIGIAHGDDPVKVEAQLCEQLPPKRWTRASDDLILHGRRICKPKPLCQMCNVRSDCDFFMSGVVTKPIGKLRLKPEATPSKAKKAAPSKAKKAAK